MEVSSKQRSNLTHNKKANLTKQTDMHNKKLQSHVSSTNATHQETFGTATRMRCASPCDKRMRHARNYSACDTLATTPSASDACPSHLASYFSQNPSNSIARIVHTSHPEACASQTITWRHPTSIIAPTYFFIPWLFKEHATTLLIDVDVAHTLNKIWSCGFSFARCQCIPGSGETHPLTTTVFALCTLPSQHDI